MSEKETRLKNGLLVRRIVDEGLLLDLEGDVGYRLNDVATSILGLLDEGIEGEALIDRLCGEFEIDRETCAREVSEFLGELEAKGILTES